MSVYDAGGWEVEGGVMSVWFMVDDGGTGFCVLDGDTMCNDVA